MCIGARRAREGEFMKTAFAAAIAAVLLWSGTAWAATASITFDGHCDGLKIYLGSKPYMTAQITGCESGIATGWLSKQGHILTFGEAPSGFPGDQTFVVLDFPLVTGGTYHFFWTTNGKTVAGSDSGTYTVH
jgi:hypothetical protein